MRIASSGTTIRLTNLGSLVHLFREAPRVVVDGRELGREKRVAGTKERSKLTLAPDSKCAVHYDDAEECTDMSVVFPSPDSPTTMSVK